MHDVFELELVDMADSHAGSPGIDANVLLHVSCVQTTYLCIAVPYLCAQSVLCCCRFTCVPLPNGKHEVLHCITFINQHAFVLHSSHSNGYSSSGHVLLCWLMITEATPARRVMPPGHSLTSCSSPLGWCLPWLIHGFFGLLCITS